MRGSLELRFLMAAAALFFAPYGCGKSSPPASDLGEEAGRPANAGEQSGGISASLGGESAGGAKGGAGGASASAGTSGADGGAGAVATAGSGSGGTAGAAATGDGGATSGAPDTGGAAATSGASAMGGSEMGGATGGMNAGAGGSAGSAGGPPAVPLEWFCDAELYGDGACDCGCYFRDVDCPSERPDACERCPSSGCSDETCSSILLEDNAFCGTLPHTWTCSERLYKDGSQCDCGCGFRDADCADDALPACDRCNAVGSCSGQACPGTIDPGAVERCVKPPAPEGWTCSEQSYADGFTCDCGCGVADLDCRASTLEHCRTCHCGGGSCEQMLEPGDTTRCSPPPEGWVCEPERWNDLVCDCGCNVPDLACGYDTLLYCVHCLGCSEGDCARLDPNDPSQCSP